MIGRVLRAVLSLVILTAVAVFAVANRDDVTLTYSPLHDPISLPVFAVALFGLLAGFLLGAGMAWIWGFERRRQMRAQKQTIKTLERDLNAALEATSQNRAVLAGAEPESAIPPRPALHGATGPYPG